MNKILKNVTIETFTEAARKANIQPGQRFSIVLEDSSRAPRQRLADIASKMRATVVARGLTTEVFDALLASD
ncbi:MAG TPA: hypothetical protein VKS60_11645 [Stellaceae bacterium]|nr:hypothetical protein [Stellaceae bacterium]